jgi:hypothetical protein
VSATPRRLFAPFPRVRGGGEKNFHLASVSDIYLPTREDVDISGLRGSELSVYFWGRTEMCWGLWESLEADHVTTCII